MWSPIDEASTSEPMGRDRIPRPRSINSTTESIKSIERTKTAVEDLFPWWRLPRALAIFEFCELELNWTLNRWQMLHRSFLLAGWAFLALAIVNIFISLKIEISNAKEESKRKAGYGKGLHSCGDFGFCSRWWRGDFDISTEFLYFYCLFKFTFVFGLPHDSAEFWYSKFLFI